MRKDEELSSHCRDCVTTIIIKTAIIIILTIAIAVMEWNARLMMIVNIIIKIVIIIVISAMEWKRSEATWEEQAAREATRLTG